MLRSCQTIINNDVLTSFEKNIKMIGENYGNLNCIKMSSNNLKVNTLIYIICFKKLIFNIKYDDNVTHAK